jgi:hypothetical protein
VDEDALHVTVMAPHHTAVALTFNGAAGRPYVVAQETLEKSE